MCLFYMQNVKCKLSLDGGRLQGVWCTCLQPVVVGVTSVPVELLVLDAVGVAD